MTSRLYPTTRRLFRQVFVSMRQLGLLSVLSPLSFALLAVYICGLILLDKRQTATRVADWLPGRAHDALNRLLTEHSISTRSLFAQVIEWAKRLGTGYLVVDEVILAKPYGKKCPWIGYLYSTSEKRYVKGMCAVVLLFCVGDWRIPIDFRLWRPKERCAPDQYRKRTELAREMLLEVAQTGLSIQYVAFDNLYTAGWLTKCITRLGWKWVGMVESKAHICYHHRLWQAAQLAATLKLKWRSAFDLRACSLIAYLPKYGTLRLVVTRNRFGNFQVLATNDLGSDLSLIITRKRHRWSIETLFRDAKQFFGFTACQCIVDGAQVLHIAFVLLAFLVLQMLRRDPKETLGSLKDRLQREAMTGQSSAPSLLKGKMSQSVLSTA
jgi:DDE superfamily endonuclease